MSIYKEYNMLLKFKGAQPTLYKANLTVRIGDKVQFDDDEANFRLKNHPGMWEKVEVVKKEVKKTVKK